MDFKREIGEVKDIRAIKHYPYFKFVYKRNLF
jgi:hypothetical protein